MKAQLNICCVFNESYSKRFSNSSRIEYVKTKLQCKNTKNGKNCAWGAFISHDFGIRNIHAKTMTIGKVFACNHQKTDKMLNALSKIKASLRLVNQEYCSVLLTGILFIIFYYVDLLRGATGGHVVHFSYNIKSQQQWFCL